MLAYCRSENASFCFVGPDALLQQRIGITLEILVISRGADSDGVETLDKEKAAFS